MTPADTERLHNHLTANGYREDEFAADMWTFVYGVFDAYVGQGKPKSFIYAEVRRTLNIERKRLAEAGK